jgi:CubicO group peptidase (beta-lactamase class C family)
VFRFWQVQTLDTRRSSRRIPELMTPLPLTISTIEQGIAAGMHPGVQLYVSLRGQTIFDDALGEAWPGEPLTRDHLCGWMSAGKPVAAIAISQLLARGLLRLDDRVAQHIPAFARHGKETVTVRHILTHTGGFRGPLNNYMRASWDEVIEAVCDLKLEPGWVPGEKAGYHPASSWFVLGELVRILDGRPFDRYVREEIFLPIGASDAWIGMPADVLASYGDRIAPLLMQDPALPHPKAPWNEPEGLIMPRPGGNARGPVRDLARLYESIIDAEFTTRQRVGMFDHTFKMVLDFGLGFLIDSKQYAGEHPYGYGKYASPDTFGHSGSQSSCAFCDPAHGLVVAWVCNAMPGEKAHDERARRINAAIYEDLGLHLKSETRNPNQARSPKSED